MEVFFERGQRLLGWVDSSTISVDPGCLLASMAAAHCVCVKIWSMSGHPECHNGLWAESHGPKTKTDAMPHNRSLTGKPTGFVVREDRR